MIPFLVRDGIHGINSHLPNSYLNLNLNRTHIVHSVQSIKNSLVYYYNIHPRPNRLFPLNKILIPS